MEIAEGAPFFDDTVMGNAGTFRQIGASSHNARQYVRPVVESFVPGAWAKSGCGCNFTVNIIACNPLCH